jgi:hypothetical protein
VERGQMPWAGRGGLGALEREAYSGFAERAGAG